MYTTVRQIIIAHGSGIDSIQVEYDKNSSSVWSKTAGGKGDKKVDKCMEPMVALMSREIYVSHLLLLSKSYGLFGVESGTYFSLPKSELNIIGFHGKADWFLVFTFNQFLKRIIPRRKFFFTHMNICLMVIRNSSTHSVIQGSVGQSFDIVVALKQKMSPLASSESRDNTGAEITKHKICLISWGKIMRSYRQKLKLMRKHMDHGVEPVVSCLTMGFIPALPNFVFVNRMINHFNLL